jgi:hypothetical protein
MVRIRDGAKGSKSFTLAAAVLRAWGEPRPLGCMPLHYPDGSQENCRLDNLRWAPRGAVMIGRNNGVFGEDNKNSLYTEDEVRLVRELYASGMSYREIESRLIIPKSTARMMVKRKCWAHVK